MYTEEKNVWTDRARECILRVMGYYIDQLHTPSFPIGLVKTETGFIVRSVETGLGRWMLVVAVISVDAYPFLAFSDLTCRLEDTRISVF